MPGEKQPRERWDGTSRVGSIARELRNTALKLRDGELIGSEEELVSYYQAARSTLRQAACLVAQEQLLYVKRGAGGGYFARRPDSRSVAHAASIYLHSRGTTLIDIIDALEPIRIEIMRRAASSADEAVKAELRALVERERDVELSATQASYESFVGAMREYSALLGRLCGNEPLSLFQSTLQELGGQLGGAGDIYAGRLDRMQAQHANMLRVSTAILDGDAEMTVLAGKRHSALLTRWYMEDLKREPGADLGAVPLPLLAGTANAA